MAPPKRKSQGGADTNRSKKKATGATEETIPKEVQKMDHVKKFEKWLLLW